MPSLLLTGAVKPTAQGQVAVRDPLARLAAYQQALLFWSEISANTGFNLVFVETSGYPLDDLRPAAMAFDPKFLSFKPSEDELRRGKGAAEAAAITHAVGSFAPNEFFLKVTGRLLLANAGKMLGLLGPRPESTFLRMNYTRPWVDTRLFGMTASSWKADFGNLARGVSEPDYYYLEHAMGVAALQAIAAGSTVRPLPRRPRWQGQSGSTGRAYGTFADRATSWGLQSFEGALYKIMTRKLM